MRFQQINVEGFGTLSQCRIVGLTDELNVIHGVNGAGKTTLMHFITGVLCGFQQAHRLKLLPPLKRGTPGGSLTVRNEQGRFDVIRHARADQSDTLAISLLQGTADDVTLLRNTLQQAPFSLISRLYAVSGYAAHDLAGLVQFALDEKIDLTSRANAGAWISEKARAMEAERAELFRTAPSQGALVALEQRRDQLSKELAETCRVQQEQLAKWQQTLQSLRQQIERLTTLRDWRDQELQLVQCELTETQDRLWSTRIETVQDVETIHQTLPDVPEEWVAQLAAVDEEIAHAQQVLRDLAGQRMTVSMSKADLAGSEVPEIETVLQRQRDALSLIETRTVQLTSLLTGMADASACLCGSRSAELQSGVDAIREQVWLICQELGRQQSAHRQDLLQNQREGIDRCEQELIRQVQRLRARRDEVLRRRTTGDHVHFRTRHETEGCQCAGHDDAVVRWTTPVRAVPASPQVVVRERTVVTSAARPDEAAYERELRKRRSALRGQLAETVEELRLARRKLQQLEENSHELAGNRTVQELQNEFTLIEQELADSREQWQSLTLLQTVLLRTQQKLNVEAVSPVITDASRLLDRMTEGRYSRFRWNGETRELLVIHEADGELPAQALSRGTLEQAVLSFRLALCQEYQRRGHHWPLILDDILTDSDEHRSQAAADVLMEFAQSHQVLFLTCQDHLVELFAARRAAVFNLPGSAWQASPRNVEPVVAPEQKSSPVALSVKSAEETLAMPERDRVQPDNPYWLQPGSPVHHVPSLGEQMSRRLGALGVRTVGELVELDPETVQMPLESLQISASTLRKWQAEARLLCCVPHLTGRDAQLLVICGVHSPAELSECDVASLLRKIAEIRSRHAGDYETQWLTQRPDWPSQLQVEQWIRSGRHARTWQTARDWSAQRQIHLGRHLARQRRRQMAAVTPVTIQPPRVRLHSQNLTEATESTWKFYLRQNSPIVDAPSIGPRMAQRLGAIGIEFVSQLLAQIPADIAHRLNRRDVTVDVVRAWQQQANLMCHVPQLRGHDAQVLVKCSITTPEMLAAMAPARLYAQIEPFVTSRDGARLLRSARVPDLEEVTDWIQFARQSPLLRAA